MNPYILLVGLIVWLASAAGAAWVGYDYRDGKVAQEIMEAQNDTLQKAATQAKDDLALAVERAKRESAAQERAAGAKRLGVADAVASARPDCVRSDVSFSLLHNAIDAANDTPAASGSLPAKLPGLAKTGERQGLNPALVGVRGR